VDDPFVVRKNHGVSKIGTWPSAPELAP